MRWTYATIVLTAIVLIASFSLLLTILGYVFEFMELGAQRPTTSSFLGKLYDVFFSVYSLLARILTNPIGLAAIIFITLVAMALELRS